MILRSTGFRPRKDHAFFGVSWFGNVRNQPNHWGTIGEPNGYANNPDHAPAKSARVDYTRIISPTLLLDFRGGAVRWGRTAPNYPLDFNMSQIGFPASLQPQMTQPVSFPWVTPSGYTAMNRNITYIFQDGTAYTMVGSATLIRGKHNIKFGAEHRIQQDFENTGFWTSGQFIFDRTFTQGPNPNVAAANLGNSIASMLLGTGSGNITKMPSVFTSNHYTGIYVQDSLKATSKLSIEIGIRYELETPRKERFNKLSYWDYNSPSPLASQVPSLNLVGGLRFVGRDADSQFNTDYNNFGPRLGLAYALGSKTVIRTGYGLFYTQCVCTAVGSGDGMNGYLNSTQWIGSLDSLTPFNYLTNAFPNGLVQPTGSSAGLLTNVGQQITGQRDGPIDRNSKVGYIQSWNFNIQRQFAGMVFEAAYVGSKGTKLGATTGWELNQLPVADLALGTALQQLVPNPFYGVISTGPLAQPTVARGQLLRPYPQFLSAITWWPAENSSTYHSVQFRVQKDFRRGFGFLLSYTGSKLIDEQGPYQNSYDRRSNRSLATIDVPQRLVISADYLLPFGKGQAFGAHLPAALNAVIGNWKLNTVVTISSGWPLSITASNVANLYNAVEQANVVGDPSLAGDRTRAQKIAQWFNTAAFQQPAPFTLGNGSRTLPTTRTDGVKNVDFSVFKSFPWGEQRAVEFRAEAFNFLNRTQFSAPGTTVGTGAFGVVSSQANLPRQVQLAIRILF
ncbi:MAG: TonB-dependent receptor domain-containing protein [Bryobacteraceae bacterium]